MNPVIHMNRTPVRSLIKLKCNLNASRIDSYLPGIPRVEFAVMARMAESRHWRVTGSAIPRKPVFRLTCTGGCIK